MIGCSAAHGADVLWGGADDDNLRGEDDGDLLNGDAGNDELVGGRGQRLASSAARATTICSEMTNNDSITGGAGMDLIQGGSGDDTFIFVDRLRLRLHLRLPARHTRTGGAALRRARPARYLLQLPKRAGPLFGGAGIDSLFGTTGSDLLFGAEGRELRYGVATTTTSSRAARMLDTLGGDGGNDVIEGQRRQRRDLGRDRRRSVRLRCRQRPRHHPRLRRRRTYRGGLHDELDLRNTSYNFQNAQDVPSITPPRSTAARSSTLAAATLSPWLASSRPS